MLAAAVRSRAAARSPRLGLVVLVLAGVAVGAARRRGTDLRPDALGPFQGWVDGDGRPAGVPGRDPCRRWRSRASASRRGCAAGCAASGPPTWQAGDQRARRRRARRRSTPTAAGASRRSTSSARSTPTWLGDRLPGGRVADRVEPRARRDRPRRRPTCRADRAALTRGLVIGDDRDEPPAMVQRFRDAGLSHLTAVSGQNVALLLAAAGPLLRRLRPLARWAASLGLIGWFVVLDARRAVGAAGRRDGRPGGDRVRARAPGRAAAPARPGRRRACCCSTRCWRGRSGSGCPSGRRPASCSAPCTSRPRLVRLGPLALPVAVTLGAQCGVAVPSLLVFGRLSLTGTVANLVAVPVAGLVMLVRAAGVPRRRHRAARRRRW